MRDMADVQQSMLNIKNNLGERLDDQSQSTKANAELSVSLPLKNYEDLMKLEEELVDEGLQQHLCNMISQVGGCNLGNCIRRVLCRVMTNELAIEFSWLGAREKRPFVNLLLKKVVFEAIRKNGLFTGASDNDIESIVKDWLRHSKARCKK